MGMPYISARAPISCNYFVGVEGLTSSLDSISSIIRTPAGIACRRFSNSRCSLVLTRPERINVFAFTCVFTLSASDSDKSSARKFDSTTLAAVVDCFAAATGADFGGAAGCGAEESAAWHARLGIRRRRLRVGLCIGPNIGASEFATGTAGVVLGARAFSPGAHACAAISPSWAARCGIQQIQ